MLWPINFFLHYPREVWLYPCSGLAVESVSFHTLLGSNQLTGANNCQNGLFKREMGPGGPLWLPACLFHPENPRVRILSHISSCCGDIESVSSGFRPERPRPGSQQSANRPLYGEIGSGPVIKSPFVRLWWRQCLQSAGLNSAHQLNLSEYNALQYIRTFTFPQKVVGQVQPSSIQAGKARAKWISIVWSRGWVQTIWRANFGEDNASV